MNRDRRTRLEAVNRKLAELQNEVSELIKEEEVAFSHLPNAMLNSEKARTMRKDIDSLNWMFDYIYDAQHTFVPVLTFYPKTACMA